MTIEEYVAELEKSVNNFDSNFVTAIKDWTPNDKLYVYLHKIQLNYMKSYYKEMDEMHRQLKWIRAQTS